MNRVDEIVVGAVEAVAIILLWMVYVLYPICLSSIRHTSRKQACWTHNWLIGGKDSPPTNALGRQKLGSPRGGELGAEKEWKMSKTETGFDPSDHAGMVIPATSLIALTRELAIVASYLDSTEGEITSEQLAARIDALPGEIAVKVSGVCRMIRHFESLVTMGKDESERIRALAAHYDRAAQRLEDYLFACIERLQEAGHPMPIRTGLHSVNVVNCGGRPTIRWAGEPDALPFEFQKVIPAKTVLDMDKVYLAEKEGRLPEGFVVERGRRLNIK